MQAVLRDGELLLPHSVGDGVTVIGPAHPDYERLRAGAVDLDAMRPTPEQDRTRADWLRARLATEDRRTA
ncbi:hypothetical protein SMC26_29305 [Actinomadura fulvescens]|uniref:Uncharacterized protein n=1 Tax=Actinomadura fulvescens TaxID=46160 RepID=A0ABP6CXJ3_9ACTN